MSDLAPAGFAPVNLAQAMAQRSGFRPLSLAPAADGPPPGQEPHPQLHEDDPVAPGRAAGLP